MSRSPRDRRGPPSHSDDRYADDRPARPKYALTNLGGPTHVAGDPRVSEVLAEALSTDDLPRDRLTHGFHSYPARMHWHTAAHTLGSLDLKGATLLDPFCGSGTVLVEAQVQGMEALGVDLNPLAVRLARLKTDPLDLNLRRQLAELGTLMRASSEERVQARENVRANLPPTELRWYEAHVLKEMAGLLQSIGEAEVEDERLREALTMVFSSLVVKFSRQRSDTSEELYERRIRKGLVSEFFERKTLELVERLDALGEDTRGPLAKVQQGDAHWLRDALPRNSVDVVLTSPPYGGTYDYAAHHARRFAWLGIDAPGLMERELGARRRGQSPDQFARELFLALRSIRQVLRSDGWLLMLLGDGQHGDERVPADALVEQIAEDAGLEPVAIASQERPDFRGYEPRQEHLMALRPV